MMQLLCDGVVLDLYDNASLQFKKDNPLFAFDSLKCERTTEFKLPSTPKNDRVFSLARKPAYDGIGMRRKFIAQLQTSGVVKDGYLYISTFDGQDYTAIFVTGEFVQLQTISSLGKINEILDPQDVVTIGGAETAPASSVNVLWANVPYYRSGGILCPSIGVKKLVEAICTEYNLTMPTIPESVEGMRLISLAKSPYKDVHFKATIIDDQQPNGTIPSNNYNTVEADDRLFDYVDEEYGVAIMQEGSIADNQWYMLRSHRAKTALQLTFPQDWPETMYMFDFTNAHYDPTYGGFYGERAFDKDVNQEGVTPIGEPLAGRTVQIAAGDCFLFVDSRYFVYTRTSIMGSSWYDYGFIFNEEPTLDYDYVIGVHGLEDQAQAGELCLLSDNLPDCTFVELLKTIAAASGRVLNYTDADGITFDEVDFTEWTKIEGLLLTKKEEVIRTFSNYAQRNLVLFESNKGVLYPLSIEYTIDNDNIETEKDLQKIPFSEGDNYGAGFVYVPKADEAERMTVSIAGNEAKLLRVSLPQNAGVQALCTASTQIKLKARLTLLKYQAITAKTLLLIDGTVYVWTSSTWQNDVASMTLAKI